MTGPPPGARRIDPDAEAARIARERTAEPEPDIVAWDWRSQPDIARLAAAVNRISGGKCVIQDYDTGGDMYAVTIAARNLTHDEQEQLWKS